MQHLVQLQGAHLTVMPAARPKTASEASSTAGRRKLMDVQLLGGFRLCPGAPASPSACVPGQSEDTHLVC